MFDFSPKVSELLKELPPDIPPLAQYRYYI